MYAHLAGKVLRSKQYTIHLKRIYNGEMTNDVMMYYYLQSYELSKILGIHFHENNKIKDYTFPHFSPVIIATTRRGLAEEGFRFYFYCCFL